MIAVGIVMLIVALTGDIGGCIKQTASLASVRCTTCCLTQPPLPGDHCLAASLPLQLSPGKHHLATLIWQTLPSDHPITTLNQETSATYRYHCLATSLTQQPSPSNPPLPHLPQRPALPGSHQQPTLAEQHSTIQPHLATPQQPAMHTRPQCACVCVCVCVCVCLCVCV